MSMSVCLSVYLSVYMHICLRAYLRNQKFSERANCGRGSVLLRNSAVRYVVPVLWLISCLPIHTQCRQWRQSLMYIIVLFTGSIAHSANLPVFSLLRGRFWGFSPRMGDTLHRWWWNLAWRTGPKVPPPRQISPPSVQRQGCGTPKIEIFTQIWPKSGI